MRKKEKSLLFILFVCFKKGPVGLVEQRIRSVCSLVSDFLHKSELSPSELILANQFRKNLDQGEKMIEEKWYHQMYLEAGLLRRGFEDLQVRKKKKNKN